MNAYLDNSATTRPHERVIAAMEHAMREGWYNPSAVYLPAVDVFREVRACREELLRAVHAPEGSRVIFTSGGTEANNLAILGAAEKLRGLKLVAVSAVEHPSVLAAYEALAEKGIEVRTIGVSPDGAWDMDAVRRAVDDGAGLVSVMQVNNETGALSDVKTLRAITKGRALLHIDGVQGFLRVPFDLKDADLYSLSAHKLHGPKGAGALLCGPGVRLAARNIGGGQENDLRSGTENTPGIAGLREAVKLISEQDMAALMQRKLRLIRAFSEAVPGLLINGPDPEHAAPHIVNLSFPGVRGEVMLHALESAGVYASTGSACSSKKRKVSAVLSAMGIPADRAEQALRFSLSPFTTDEEIDHAAEALGRLYPTLKKFQRR